MICICLYMDRQFDSLEHQKCFMTMDGTESRLIVKEPGWAPFHLFHLMRAGEHGQECESDKWIFWLNARFWLNLSPSCCLIVELFGLCQLKMRDAWQSCGIGKQSIVFYGCMRVQKEQPYNRYEEALLSKLGLWAQAHIYDAIYIYIYIL